MDAVCAAGKAEGQVNLIATPPDWANYGQMITDFTAKYGIKVQSDQPDVDSAAEITAAKNLAGTGRQPDIFDLATSVALANTAMFAPYQVAGWADIPDTNKEATGLWTNNYTGYESISYDAKLGDITKMSDLLDPKYKGKMRALTATRSRRQPASTASSLRRSPTAGRPTTSPPASTSSRSCPTRAISSRSTRTRRRSLPARRRS